MVGWIQVHTEQRQNIEGIMIAVQNADMKNLDEIKVLTGWES